MKRRNIIAYITMLLIGAGLIAAALLYPDFSSVNYLWGMAGGLIGSSLVNLSRAFYWSRPTNAPKYEEMLKEQRISLNDERKIHIRERVGRQCFIYSFWAQAVIFAAIAILRVAPVWVSTVLWAFWLIELFGSRFYYRQVEKTM